MGGKNISALLRRPVRVDASGLCLDDRVELRDMLVTHPSGVAARSHSLREEIRKNNLELSPEELLAIASLTSGRPGRYIINHNRMDYTLTIKGQTTLDGRMYGILTSARIDQIQ